MKFIISVFVLTAMNGCFDPENKNKTKPTTPVFATGDEKAILLAQRVIDANGGKKNWDNVPYVSFDYFGRRYWFWDKINNRFRVESDIRKFRIAGVLDGSETHLWLRDEIIADTDSIIKYKEFAYKAWINDTYWLLFPLKLLDPGVHLKYLGECIADSNTNATCIELTFEKVGVTPENKYIAYIDTVKNEIIYWDFFENKTDPVPSISNSWTDYRMYGKLKLSGGRGDDTIKEITIHEKLPEEIFTDVSRSYRDILK